MHPASRRQALAIALILALAAAGLGVNVHLLLRTTGAASIAGCGGGPCDELLASRWSSLLGVPLPVFGMLVYVLLPITFFRRLEVLRPLLLGVIAGAAFWLIAVQAVVFGKFCLWCTVAHVIGVAVVISCIPLGRADAWRHILAWAVLAVLALASLQIFGPARASYRVDGGRSPHNAAVPGPTVSFNRGGIRYHVAEHPRIGPLDASRVLVGYFDYQCSTCRAMSGHIDALIAAHPGRVAVLMMPVPLEERCNPHLGANRSHAGSCAISRIALAVWRARPEAFPDFHRRLVASPSEPAARALALEMMDPSTLERTLADPWIDRSLAANCEAWRSFSTHKEKLPKLLIRDTRILHGLPPDPAQFLSVVRQELGF